MGGLHIRRQLTHLTLIVIKSGFVFNSSRNATFSGNIAVNPGKKIQLSGAGDSTSYISFTSDDLDIINYSTGFKLEHYQSELNDNARFNW